MKPQITIRLARNDEAEIIRLLVSEFHNYDFSDINWASIEPYWLAAEYDGEIIGCLQAMHGLPFGVIGFLSFIDSLNPMQTARASKLLIGTAISSLTMAGVSALFTAVPFEQKQFKKLIKKHWYGEVYKPANVMIKRLM